MILRKKKDERNIVIDVILRYKTIFFLLLALIGLYANQKGSSLILIKEDSTVWTQQSAAPTTKNGMGTNRNDDEPAFLKEQHPTNLTVSTLPIHIIQPSANHSSVLPWRTLASSWDRNTTFENLLEISHNSPLPPIPPNHRVAIILHCSPKMGSLTLRKACKNNLQNSCGMEPKGRIDPNGYSNITWFSEIIQQCDTTHHFCLRLGMFKKEMEKIEGIVFFHLYPFRKYDSWAISALKQPYDRGGERGCNDLRNMMDKCSDRHGELAFFKYTKTKMSKVQPLVVHRINEMKETHHTLLYPYFEVDGLLSVLSEAYQVPLLPGSNGTHHTERPKNGTCDKSILDQFHDCFTSKLMELP
mmetsp:Transcript_20510/g.44513  ORF Transcript_20510/g.44513 Transcript_20510/m.44513 type:complete len:357 (-) Transcript_20510:54-1124(-)